MDILIGMLIIVCFYIFLVLIAEMFIFPYMDRYEKKNDKGK
jgi:hypothetical protein